MMYGSIFIIQGIGCADLYSTQGDNSFFAPLARWGSLDFDKHAIPSLPAGHALTRTSYRELWRQLGTPEPEHMPERIPNRMPGRDRMPDRMSEYMSIQCQNIRQNECPNRCQIEGQNECLKRCRVECQKKCQREFHSICQKGLSDRMS